MQYSVGMNGTVHIVQLPQRLFDVLRNSVQAAWVGTSCIAFGVGWSGTGQRIHR